jgi:hypothetical protein
VLRAEVYAGTTLVASPDFTETGPWLPGNNSSTPARNDGQGRPWSLIGDGVISSPWTNLTSRVGYPDGFTWNVGRYTERDQGDAGNGTIVFDNSDRALDPTNEASPFWPHVRPMTRIRVRATHASVTYPIFEAYARAWPPYWEGSGYGHVTVPLVDGFKLLATARTSVSLPVQSTGTRVNALLDQVNWPANRRQVDAGQSDIQAYDASDRIVINALRDTATVESGVFFIGPQGDAIFRDRYSRVVSDSVATFGETTPDVLYEDIDISYDDGEIWNDVAVKPVGLTVQRAVDEPSKDAYGHRWLERSDILITTELEAQDRAHWDLSRYRQPRMRVDRLHLRGDLFNPTLVQVLARGIGDRITVKAQPAGGGAQVVREVFIENIIHRVTADSWSTTWQLSPAFGESVWLIGVVGQSEIGQTTKVGY